jgi:threonine dehydrogenase-like Zn-dependent dehydrogenase
VGVERKPEFFADKGIKIGIIGCGYVGLPLALRFADIGQRVTGFDLDHSKIEKLNAGKSYIQHIPSEKIKAHVDAKKFDATSDFARLRDMDAILICVPTPLDERREPDLSYVENTARAIAPTCNVISSSLSKASPTLAAPKSWCSRFSKKAACAARSRTVSQSTRKLRLRPHRHRSLQL